MFNKKGITLIELIIALAIVGIIITIAVSSMANIIPHIRLNDAATELVSNINLARAIAISRNKACVVSFNKTDSSYTVFVDDNNSAPNWHIEDGEEIIALRHAPSGVIIIKASFSSGTSAFGYDSEGLPLDNRIGSVCFKNSKNEYHKISVSWTGRPKLYKNVKQSECN